MKLQLSKKDLQAIADLITYTNQESGFIVYPAECINDEIIVEFTIDAEYSQDYSYDGSGDVTCVSVDVTIDDVYVSGMEIEVEYDKSELEEMVENNKMN